MRLENQSVESAGVTFVKGANVSIINNLRKLTNNNNNDEQAQTNKT